MVEADIPAMLGYLFGAWGLGWGLGYMFYAVRNGIRKIL